MTQPNRALEPNQHTAAIDAANAVEVETVKLAINTTAFIEGYKRVAGVESGRIYSEWLHCPFFIEPSKTPSKGFQRGYAWRVTFNAVDGKDPQKEFSGVGETRAHARQMLIHTVTGHIKAVVGARAEFMKRHKAALELSLAAGLTDGVLKRAAAT